MSVLITDDVFMHLCQVMSGQSTSRGPAGYLFKVGVNRPWQLRNMLRRHQNYFVKGAMLMLSQWEVKNRNILKTDRDISLKFGKYLLHGYTKPTLDKLFDSVQYSRWYCTIKVEKLKSLSRNSLNVIQTRRKKWMAPASPQSGQQFYVLRFSIFFLQCCKKWK